MKRSASSELAGLLECPNCGSRMSPFTTPGKTGSHDKQGRAPASRCAYVYLRCLRAYDSVPRCTNRQYVRNDTLLRLLLDHLSSFLTRSDDVVADALRLVRTSRPPYYFHYARATVHWLRDRWDKLSLDERAAVLRILVSKVSYARNGSARPDEAVVITYGPALVEVPAMHLALATTSAARAGRTPRRRSRRDAPGPPKRFFCKTAKQTRRSLDGAP